MLPTIMKKITGSICIILMTVIFTVHPAFADTETGAYPYYISANLGQAKLTDRCTNLAAGFSCKDSALSYALDGGYQFNKYLGLEFTLASYGSPKTSGTVLGSNLEVADEVSGFRFSGTLSLPLTDSFALTGRLGYAQTNINVISIVAPGPSIPNYQTSSNTFAYGAGLKYNLNKNFSLHVKYDNMGQIGDDTAGKYNLSQLSAGISYSFDLARPRQADNKAIGNKQPLQAESPSTQASIRIILQFKKSPAKNSPELKVAIAQSCQCEPYFVRLQNMNSIIYQINLATDQTFANFRDALLTRNSKLGIKDLTQE